MSAQSWCCDRQGARLDYTRYKADYKTAVWHHSLRVIAVTTGSGTKTVRTVSHFSKPDGKDLYKADVSETMRIDTSTCDLSVEFGTAAASYMKARAGLEASAMDAGLTVMPANIRPGDKLEPISVKCGLGPLTYRIEVFNRQVLRKETITVPAGTFDCLVISEDRNEDGPGHHRHTTGISWYVKGIGYVRHDTCSRKGELQTTEVLVKLN